MKSERETTESSRLESSGSETDAYYYRARYYDPQAGRFIGEDPVRFQGGINFYGYVRNNSSNFLDPSGLCRVSVGHHAIFALVFTCGSINVEHTYVVLGEGKNRQVLNSAPDGPICPWCSPKIDARVYPYVRELEESRFLDEDQMELITPDDGRPCQLDQKILQGFASGVSGQPYDLRGPNSNSVASGGLQALGYGGWSPSFFAPGWGVPIPH
jgi:RHS repeat-associated protein